MRAFFLFLFLCNASYAGHGTFFKYNLGFGEPNQQSISSIKAFSGGYQDEISIFEEKTEVGFWVDTVHNMDTRNSAFASYSLGIEPRCGNIYMNVFQGVALISTPDAMLGSYYQFVEDFGLGVRDERGVGIGFTYKHISNAGIKQPNHGRDFFGLQAQIPL